MGYLFPIGAYQAKRNSKHATPQFCAPSVRHHNPTRRRGVRVDRRFLLVIIE